MVASDPSYHIGLAGTTAGISCPNCGGVIMAGSTHHCPAHVTVSPPVSIPSIWGVTPTTQPSLARTRLERQIAKLEPVIYDLNQTLGVTSTAVETLDHILACLRDLAEDL